MSERKRASPRRWFECTLARSQYKVRTEEMFKCNVYLVRNSPLSSVSSIRKQRDREEFLLTLAKARVPLSFSVMSILYRGILRNAWERHAFSRRNSYPTSSFEIGPKESRIDATGRKIKLSLILVVLSFLRFFLLPFSSILLAF